MILTYSNRPNSCAPGNPQLRNDYAACRSRRVASTKTLPASVRKETIRMKMLGFILVILGILAMLYGGISYNRQRTVLDVGPFKATATEQKNIPLSPIAGGILLDSGVILLVVPRKRAP